LIEVVARREKKERKRIKKSKLRRRFKFTPKLCERFKFALRLKKLIINRKHMASSGAISSFENKDKISSF